MKISDPSKTYIESQSNNSPPSSVRASLALEEDPVPATVLPLTLQEYRVKGFRPVSKSKVLLVDSAKTTSFPPNSGKVQVML